jgi:hypothetical protein
MYLSSAKNKDAPNWSDYRMGRPLVIVLKNITTRWRITCSFPQDGVDTETDYVRAVFADFNLLRKIKNECKNVSYISVMGQSCSECTAQWTHIDNFTPPPLHIAAIPQNDLCDIKSDNTGYYFYNPLYRISKINNELLVWFLCLIRLHETQPQRTTKVEHHMSSNIGTDRAGFLWWSEEE